MEKKQYALVGGSTIVTLQKSESNRNSNNNSNSNSNSNSSNNATSRILTTNFLVSHAPRDNE
eukprot:7476860-Pyramimonas_sp.AAC.1